MYSPSRPDKTSYHVFLRITPANAQHRCGGGRPEGRCPMGLSRRLRRRLGCPRSKGIWPFIKENHHIPPRRERHARKRLSVNDPRRKCHIALAKTSIPTGRPEQVLVLPQQTRRRSVESVNFLKGHRRPRKIPDVHSIDSKSLLAGFIIRDGDLRNAFPLGGSRPETRSPRHGGDRSRRRDGPLRLLSLVGILAKIPNMALAIPACAHQMISVRMPRYRRARLIVRRQPKQRATRLAKIPLHNDARFRSAGEAKAFRR